MTPRQSRMAREAVKWTLDDLAGKARVSLLTAVLFEAGEEVEIDKIAAMRRAFEAQHIRFMDQGALAGGIIRSRIRYVDKTPPSAALPQH